MVNRRTFLKSASLLVGVGGTFFHSALASAVGERLSRIGVQLFTLPVLAGESLEAALKLIADNGYKEVEFFGPYPWSPPASIERWRPIAAQLGIKQDAYYGMTVQQVRDLLDQYGLSSPSMHADLGTIRASLEQGAEAAAVLGQKYIAMPNVQPQERESLDAYKRLADEFNEIGARARNLGLRLTYHNHGYEHAEMEGQVPFDVLLERTDPELVFMEMDIFWTIAGGADPVAYLDAHPGRFRLMHLKDMREKVRFTGDGGTPDQWMALFPFMADAGDGVLDLARIVRHAERSGVEHFFLERDLAKDPAMTLRTSFQTLSSIELDQS